MIIVYYHIFISNKVNLAYTIKQQGGFITRKQISDESYDKRKGRLYTCNMWIGLSRVSVTINYTSLVANGHFNILYNSSGWGHIQMIYWYFTNNCIESMTLIYVPLMYLLHCLLYIYILSIINDMMNR